MTRIVAAGNTEIPAYFALLARGYTITRQTVPEEDRLNFSEIWHADNGVHQLSAFSPLQLLGLAGLVETRGEDWEAGASEFEEFMKKFS